MNTLNTAAPGVRTFHAAPDATPFLVETLLLRERPDRDAFAPAARLLMTQALRTSGLLAVLPESELKTLLTLLTFLSPNGRCHATIQELAEAMNLPETKVRARMERLAGIVWKGQPVVRLLSRESGLDGYVPSEAVVTMLPIATEERENSVPPISSPGREALVAHSRAAFGTPRAEAERLVAEQLGLADPNDDSPEAQLRRRLRAVGLLSEQIELLFAHYPTERIERQLAWLPHRHAKSLARFLLAAIEHDYEPPAFVRLQQALAQEQRQEAGVSSQAAKEEQPVTLTGLEELSSDGE